MLRKFLRGQSEFVVALAVAVMLSLTVMVVLRFAIISRQQAEKTRSMYVELSQGLEEYVVFSISGSTIYATSNMRTDVVYRTIVYNRSNIWVNTTIITLSPNAWVEIYKGNLTQFVEKCSAFIYAVTKRGRVFGWCPTYIRMTIYNTTLRTILMPSGSYEVYTARIRYVVLNASYVGSCSFTTTSGYIYASYTLSGGITSLLTPIYVFYYGDVKVLERSWVQGGMLYTLLNVSDSSGSRYYAVIVDERGNAVGQSSNGVSKVYDSYLVVPELGISALVGVYTVGTGDFVIMWLKLESGYIHVYTYPGGSSVRLKEATTSISSSFASQTTVTIDAGTSTPLSNARLYTVYSYSTWRWPLYSLDEYRVTMELGKPSSLSLVLLDPRTMYGRGVIVTSAQNVIADSRRVSGYVYNLDPPITIMYTRGTATSTTGAWNLNANQPLNHFVEATATFTVGGKQFRAVSRVDMSVTVSEGSVPPPSTQPTPIPPPSPPPPLGRIVAEQSPAPSNSTPIDTAITLKTDSKWLADNAVIEYEVHDLSTRESISGTGRFSLDSAGYSWSYKLNGGSKKYIRITIKVNDAELYRATFYNYLEQR